MADRFTATVPQSAHRRLILALHGWRFDRQAGGWTWCGLLALDEEVLDRMSDREFETFVTSWSATAASAN